MKTILETIAVSAYLLLAIVAPIVFCFAGLQKGLS